MVLSITFLNKLTQHAAYSGNTVYSASMHAEAWVCLFFPFSFMFCLHDILISAGLSK